MSALLQIFRLDTSDADLTRAQFQSFCGHIPLLYAILVCNTLAIVFYSFEPSQILQTLIAPIAICTVALVRARWWSRQSETRHLSDAQITAHLKRTCSAAIVMTITYNAWVIWVFQDADVVSRSNLTFFLALSQVSTVFCLMTLRAAAMLVALISTVSFALYFAWVDDWQLLPQALVLACVCAGMVMVTLSFNRSFSELVKSREALRLRQLETERLSDENRRIAFSDPLTGLPNRREFLARLDAIEADEHHCLSTLAVMFIDLDSFKEINDEHGHQAGDELIRTIADRLRQQCPEQGVLARVGGDEFTILLDTSKTQESAQPMAVTLAMRLLEEIALPVTVDSHVMQVGGSIGVTANIDASASPRELLRRADLAMYHAKTQGKGKIAIYSDELDKGRLRRLDVEKQIASGLRHGEFDVAYQPIVDTHSGAIVAAEALLRWPRRSRGELWPSEFISIAEATGQIHSLGLFALERACRELRPLPGLILSVNVTPSQFRHPSFGVSVMEILEKTGFPPERLKLEITESFLVTDPNRAIRVVSALRAKGITFALDDFGTGYTSLDYLHSYGFSHIKIDKSLIMGLEPESMSRMLVSSAVSLASVLGMQIIAEGVETPAQANILRDLGCHAMQGYLFGRPMPLEQLCNRLSSCRARGRSGLRQTSS
ncbi:putative bifunctional diguanylate cyclase/phosphodiesterase [Porphyrobacter sp. AAP60]|uniref:putative bifunctional diguanylate cyclase/phosphodiesterase n=1 Tax=Porphyrobacter sp. AAP60 TaxID=1523423 RepID=UPI0006B9D894|nr:EAL domain-containing protein [Porphyrobacter sp. AAP60]KPF63263.1 diguanylate cyclase [Porphyrobacter sp. AAP60]